jgi:hypothetical protein
VFIKRVFDFARFLLLGGLQKIARGEDLTTFDFAGIGRCIIHGLLKDVDIPAIEEVSVETPSGGVLHSPFKGPFAVAWPQTRRIHRYPRYAQRKWKGGEQESSADKLHCRVDLDMRRASGDRANPDVCRPNNWGRRARNGSHLGQLVLGKAEVRFWSSEEYVFFFHLQSKPT